MKKFNQFDYQQEYAREHYSRPSVIFLKSDYQAIKNHAAAMGESVSAFLKRAAQSQIEIDNAAQAPAPADEIAAPTVQPAPRGRAGQGAPLRQSGKAAAPLNFNL